MSEREARLVYQLLSTETSPARNQISSDREASSERVVETLVGIAERERA